MLKDVGQVHRGPVEVGGAHTSATMQCLIDGDNFLVEKVPFENFLVGGLKQTVANIVPECWISKRLASTAMNRASKLTVIKEKKGEMGT